MAFQSSLAAENLNSGFTPLVERLHSFANIDITDPSYINKMKDFLHGNYDNAICNSNKRKKGNRKLKQNEKTKIVSDTSVNNEIDLNKDESVTDKDEQKDSNDLENSSIDNNIKTEADVDDSIPHSDNVPSSSTEKDVDDTENNVDMDDDRMVIDTSVEDGMKESRAEKTTGDDIVAEPQSNKKAKLSKDLPETTVSECDSTSSGSDFVVEKESASEIDNTVQSGDLTNEPENSEEKEEVVPELISEVEPKKERWTMKIKVGSTSSGSDFVVEKGSDPEYDSTKIAGDLKNEHENDKEKEEVIPELSSDVEPKKERWTMKIKVGSTSDGSRCEIIKQIDYEDAKKNGLIQNKVEESSPSKLIEPDLMQTIQPLNSSSPSKCALPNDIKSVVGKRKKDKKGSRTGDTSLISTGGTPPKKLKGGLRSDCPSFCRTNCTKIHHPLLVSARRMIENDSSTTIIFLEEVSRYYGGDLGQMTPATEIHDPWKDTSYPLLHYLALMGKCSGCFALVDAGHSCIDAVTSTGQTVLHTIVKELYNFNCTHGHMDILHKKFTILLKEFGSCLIVQNEKKETPLHILGKLISDTANLIKVPGKHKLPYRLYQFAKNMLVGCLEQFSVLGLNPEVLNSQDNEGNTVAHYVAQDRASNNLLDMLLERGAELNILNNSQQSIEHIKETAPPPPDGEVLQMAEFSNKGNKYKKAVNKKTRMTIGNLKAQNLAKQEPEKDEKKEIISDESAESFMDMINSKLSDGASWEPIENMQLKKKTEKKTKTVSSPYNNNNNSNSNCKKPSQTVDSKTLSKLEPEKKEKKEIISDKSTESFMDMINSKLSDGASWEPIENLQFKKKAEKKTKALESQNKNNNSKKTSQTLNPEPNVVSTESSSKNDTKVTVSISVPSSSSASVTPFSSTTTATSSISLPKVSSSIADVTTTKATTTTTMIPPEAIKVEKSDEPMHSESNPISNKSIVATLSKISNSVKTSIKITTPKVSTTIVSTPQTKLQIDKPKLSIPTVRPEIVSSTSSQEKKYPIISNVQSIAKQGLQGMHNGIQEGMQNAHMHYGPQGPPIVAQRPRPNTMNRHPVPGPRQRPPPPPNSSSSNSKHPLLLKTSDGKLMSINVVQVTKGPSQTNVTWNPPLPVNMPQNLNIYPVAPHQRPQYFDPNNVRYVSPSMASNSYRCDSNRNLSSIPHQRPIAPNIFPYRNTCPPNSHNSNHNYPHQPVYQRLVQQPVPNVHFHQKPHKSRLEASIENIRHSMMNSSSNSNKNENLNKVNKSRLSANLKNQPDESPQVIILDEEASVKTDTRELQSPSIESSQDLHSPQDMDGVASFMKNYLQEKGSIDDFVKFSNEKKKGLLQELEEQRKMLKGINNEILLREVDIKDTRESVVSKEMEIAHLRLKLQKIQNDVVQLKNNRQSMADTCTDIEKRMKNLEEQTSLFTSWSSDTGRMDK